MLAKTISGFASSAGGFFLVFNYLDGLNHQSNNLVFLGLSIPLIAGGIVLIYKGGRTDYSEKIIPANSQKTGQDNIIERNNKIAKEWIQSTESSEKLKLLEVQASEESEK